VKRRELQKHLPMSTLQNPPPPVEIVYACSDCRVELRAADHLALMPAICSRCGYPNQVPASPTGEQWRQIPDVNGYFEVSNFGRIRRVRMGRGAKLGALVTPRVDKAKGHANVSLAVGHGVGRTAKVHKLVWQAFEGPIPPGMHVAHISPERDAQGALHNHRGNLELRHGSREG